MVKVMPCPTCNKEFNHKGKFKKHLLSHEQIKPHKCPNCGVSLSALWVLKRHLETKHSGIKPYSCFECKVNFTSKDHLHRHLNTIKHNPGLRRIRNKNKKGSDPNKNTQNDEKNLEKAQSPMNETPKNDFCLSNQQENDWPLIYDNSFKEEFGNAQEKNRLEKESGFFKECSQDLLF